MRNRSNECCFKLANQEGGIGQISRCLVLNELKELFDASSGLFLIYFFEDSTEKFII